MPGRLLSEDFTTESKPQNLILHGGPNWTAVWFFTALASLHFTVFAFAFSQAHFEGFMSLLFGTSFAIIAVACYLTRSEIAVIAAERRIRLRTGFRRYRIERFVSFNSVRSVRLTFGHDPDHANGLIEMVCADEVIECPPTPVARQEALCLAMTMGVGLVKVSDDRGFTLPRDA